MVRALFSHQCGPGSIPGGHTICGLSLLLVLVLAPRVFLRVLRFSSFQKKKKKKNISKFQFDPETVEVRATSWIPLKFFCSRIPSVTNTLLFHRVTSDLKMRCTALLKVLKVTRTNLLARWLHFLIFGILNEECLNFKKILFTFLFLCGNH